MGCGVFMRPGQSLAILQRSKPGDPAIPLVEVGWEATVAWGVPTTLSRINEPPPNFDVNVSTVSIVSTATESTVAQRVEHHEHNKHSSLRSPLHLAFISQDEQGDELLFITQRACAAGKEPGGKCRPSPLAAAPRMAAARPPPNAAAAPQRNRVTYAASSTHGRHARQQACAEEPPSTLTFAVQGRSSS